MLAPKNSQKNPESFDDIATSSIEFICFIIILYNIGYSSRIGDPMEAKTKEQLKDELSELRKRIGELEKTEIQRKNTEEALKKSDRSLRDKVFLQI